MIRPTEPSSLGFRLSNGKSHFSPSDAGWAAVADAAAAAVAAMAEFATIAAGARVETFDGSVVTEEGCMVASVGVLAADRSR